MPTTKPETDPRGDNQVLDKALADTFPASDPPAATSFTPPVVHEDEEACVAGWRLMGAETADKPPAEWRSCGHARWVSPGQPCLQLAMSPALALLDALVAHGLAPGQDWRMVHLALPASAMRRLDTPHEGWRERTFRADVRLAGDRWMRDRESVGLRVPSPLCPGEHNLLVNLQHPELEQLRVLEVCPFEVDARLTAGG